MKQSTSFIFIFIIILWSCYENKNTNLIENPLNKDTVFHKDVIKNRYENSFFWNNKNGDFEEKRIQYIHEIYTKTDFPDSLDLYDIYVDSVDFVINQLGKLNKDGLSYSVEKLQESKKYFLTHLESFFSAEIDSSQGTEYNQYRQDNIDYQLISYYYTLKDMLCEHSGNTSGISEDL